MQWNCRGLRAQAEQLKVLLHDLDPGIVCLQELKLGPLPYNPGLNYSFHSCNPPPGVCAKGGAGVISRKSIQLSLLQLHTTLQAVTVCSVYLPPDEVSLVDLQSLVSQSTPLSLFYFLEILMLTVPCGEM